MKLTYYIILAIVSILGCSGCSSQDSSKEEYILEWIGKRMSIPAELLHNDSSLIKENIEALPDFKIIAYYDSVGCTSCRMKLYEWNKFLWELDTLDSETSIEVILIASSKDKELLKLVKEYSFQGKLILDSDNLFSKANELPEDPHMQTFLLDRDNNILLIGNPIDFPKLRKLYVKYIVNNDIEVDETDDQEPIYECDLGNVKKGDTIRYSFPMSNNSTDTLSISNVVTSCECTSVSASRSILPPGESYTIDITFCDTILGEFYRLVSIIYDNNQEEELILSGSIFN